MDPHIKKGMPIMNRPSKLILQKTAKELMDWRIRCRTETVHLDRRLEIILGALANIAIALSEEELDIVDVEVLPDKKEETA